MKDITNKTKLTLLLIFWAIIFFIAGMGMAKSDYMTYNMLYTQQLVNTAAGNYCRGDVTKIVVEKSKKTMILYDDCNREVKSYKVRVGKNKGAKHCDGDKKTPEGTYHITEKRDSKYHKFLALDYPQAKDLKKAKELGCYAGDSIGIHSWIEGLPKEGSLGCITVWTKEEILEINSLVKVGTTVEILP